MRRPRTRLLITALAIVGSVLVLGRQGPVVQPMSVVPNSESAEVARRVRNEFDSPFANAAVLLIEQLPVAVTTDSGRALVRRVLQPLGAVPGITAVLSPASSLDTLLHSSDGHAALALIGYRDDAALDGARARVATAVAGLGHDGVVLDHGWTGEQPLVRALHDQTLASLRSAEWIAVPLTLFAGWWAFGGFLPGALALLGAGGAVVVGLATLRLAAPVVSSGPIADAMVVLVGAALTLDYLLWRTRGAMPTGAVARAAGCAALAFGALLLAPTAELRSAGLGGLVGIVVALAATTLWPGSIHPVAHSTTTARVVGRVVRTPGRAALAATTLLLGLGAFAVTMPPASRPDRWLPTHVEATEVLARLEGLGRGAAAAPITVLVPMPGGATVYDEAGWDAVRRAVADIRTVPGVADVRAITEIGTGERTIAENVLPAAVRAAWVSTDRRVAAVQVLPSGDATSVGRTVTALRARVGPGQQVGGLAALATDHAAAMRAALVPLLALIALGTTGALWLVFRAPLLALKAVAIDLLVAGAALGVVALTFPGIRQDGFPVTIPLLALGAAFALSIDYELLLLFAVRQRRGTGLGDQIAIVDGTAAATPMMVRGAGMLVALFAAFAVQGFAPLAMTGTVLLAAVVLDITVVRLILAPALLTLWGRWNWWPGSDPRVAGSGPLG